MLSPAPFCFSHVLYSISFVQLAAVFQPLLLLSPVYRKNPALTRKMFRFLFCRRKYGILIIQILSCYQLNQIALRSIMEPFNTPLKIREISLPHRAVFGPMAGFTDAPARRLMAQHGAGFTVSEMVSSRALVYGDHKTVSLLKAEPNGHSCAAAEPTISFRLAIYCLHACLDSSARFNSASCSSGDRASNSHWRQSLSIS